MAITLKSSASCGDIIYSMPLARQLHEESGAEIVYLIQHDTHHAKNRSVNTYKALRVLLEHQSYISACFEYKGQKVDYDLDHFRKYKLFKSFPIWLNHFKSQAIKPLDGAFRKWLEFDPVHKAHDTIFAETKRYRDYKTNLSRLAENSNSKKVVFCGTDNEYSSFDSSIPHAQTYNLYDVANLLNQSKKVYCNQSAVLTIAQGLNHQGIHLAKDKSFNNTVFGNEILLP